MSLLLVRAYSVLHNTMLSLLDLNSVMGAGLVMSLQSVQVFGYKSNSCCISLVCEFVFCVIFLKRQ